MGLKVKLQRTAGGKREIVGERVGSGGLHPIAEIAGELGMRQQLFVEISHFEIGYFPCKCFHASGSEKTTECREGGGEGGGGGKGTRRPETSFFETQGWKHQT